VTTVGGLLARLRQGTEGSKKPVGAGEVVDRAAEKARLAELGEDGERARWLDSAVDGVLEWLNDLSALTAPLAISYLDRIARPLTAMDMGSAVHLTTRGYAAHLVVEQRGGEIGIEEVPVLSGLPAMKHGRPPQDLLNRVVKISRRNFDTVRAVSWGTWEGLVVITARRIHANRRPDADSVLPPALDVAVIDALLRFGWVLRQVDLYYGIVPDRS
jgi:hypothetical protein